MTSVLLISDSERVQRIFQNLEATGVLKLQTASTLPSGEAQLGSNPCDFTFVQSRISGFSGDILLRHLEKMLQKGATLVLLGDAEDAEQARRHGRQSVDLTLGDELLAQTLKAVVTGGPLPVPEMAETPAATEPAASKKEPAPSTAPPEAEGDQPSAAPAASPYIQAADPLASPFEDAMQRAAANVAPIKASLLEVEDRIEVGKGGTAAGKGPVPPLPPAGEPARPDQDDFFAGETLLEAMRRVEKKKSRRPYLLIVPALVLIAIPFISYTVGERSPIKTEIAPAFKPEKKEPAAPLPAPPKAALGAPQGSSGKAPASPAPPPAAPQAGKPATPPPAPAARPEPLPAPKSAPPPAAAKPAAKRGAERLPPMLEGTRPDAQYGKTHPGWERYVGLLAEYKLFRENNLYKALQVVPVAGGTISDELFKRILLEFGGADSYRIDSREKKGGYLIEQGSTKGNTALTIYRNRNNGKMKGLVVYYR